MSQSSFVNGLFKEVVKTQLEPTLDELLFERYYLPKGWIYPTFLYKQKSTDLWFGTSYDWRDHYFEADLGRLYLFKDICPRVNVVGFNLADTEFHTYLPEVEGHIKNVIDKTRKSILQINHIRIYENLSKVINQKIENLSKYIDKEIVSEEEIPLSRSHGVTDI